MCNSNWFNNWTEWKLQKFLDTAQQVRDTETHKLITQAKINAQLNRYDLVKLILLLNFLKIVLL